MIEQTFENFPTMPEKKQKGTEEDSSNSSSASDDKSAVSREQSLKMKLAATRDMQLMADDDLPEDGIDAFNMMPNALNTGMFDSDIFGDLDDL